MMRQSSHLRFLQHWEQSSCILILTKVY